MNLLAEAACLLCFPFRECCQSQVFTLYTLPFEQTDVELLHNQSELCAHLKSKKIELNPRIHFRLPSPNTFFESRIETFRRSLDHSIEVDRLKDRLFNEVEMLEMKELNQGVALCCQKLNELVKGRYALGFAKNKSQTFVGELALPYLKHLPEMTFSVATDKGTRQSMLTSDITDYVVFDDASYSGHQLQELIYGFCTAANEFLFRTPRLFLVVPFMSSVALSVFKQISHDSTISGLEIHLITTTRRIKAVRDRFSNEEMGALDKWLGSICRAGTLSLTFAEWKTPMPPQYPEKSPIWNSPFKLTLKQNLSLLIRKFTRLELSGHWSRERP